MTLNCLKGVDIMKIVKFIDHYNAVKNALVEAEKDYDAAMWLLDYSDDDEETAIRSAEIAEENVDILKEEKDRIFGIIDVAKEKHNVKYHKNIGFDVKWEFKFKDINVPKKVADVIYC
jgi:hypothetical protein